MLENMNFKKGILWDKRYITSHPQPLLGFFCLNFYKLECLFGIYCEFVYPTFKLVSMKGLDRWEFRYGL